MFHKTLPFSTSQPLQVHTSLNCAPPHARSLFIFVLPRLESNPVVGWLIEEIMRELQQLREFNHCIPLTVISILVVPAGQF